MSRAAADGRRPAAAWSLPHRLARLVVGQLLFGLALAMILRAGLGASPWDVLHQGVVRQSGLGFGLVVLLSGLVVLLLWVPLRVRPGIGTLGNVVLVALSIEVGLRLLPAAASWPLAVLLLVGGVLLNGAATALYVGAALGPGPRDGLMTGLSARTGLPVGPVRAAIEVSVVAGGWALGGTVGVGTLVYALGIGPVVGLLLPRLAMPGAGAAVGARRRPAAPGADPPPVGA
ncbi:YitT family protein [uncultured Pseudokineococcus sp.]|uniref:membrane protein YczE n=1 Tax=uncultured Pseudokineococcus sp. TaxID=1642928 RepID=UPI00261075D8|nr:hypothetical protein [uncultured Pseudokineococcus sp.]